MNDEYDLRSKIHSLSILPIRYQIMMEHALLAVSDSSEREQLCKVACKVSNMTWQIWQSWRYPEDNRQEHEWVVFAFVMKITESEGLTLSEKSIATLFSFLHDTAFIKRIMEEEIRSLEQNGKCDDAKRLRKMKKNQRVDHMLRGAENARFVLKRLSEEANLRDYGVTEVEIDRCIALIAEHDAWKVDPPSPSESTDRLATACLEADALWVIYPIGVIADLERSSVTGKNKDLFEPNLWKNQAANNLKTLMEYRLKWNLPEIDFVDRESIFRTNEGYRLFKSYREFWNL